MPRHGNNTKAGQRGRSGDANAIAIEGLLSAAEAAKTDAEKKGEPYTPDPLLTVSRILGWPNNDRFLIMSPKGVLINVRCVDRTIAYVVSRACKACKQTQAGSEIWPMVAVSLPERPGQTGEILALVLEGRNPGEPKEVAMFKKLLFPVYLGAAAAAEDGLEGGFCFADDLDSEDEEVNIDAI